MSSLGQPQPGSDLEALLQQCLERPEHDQLDELERLCALHPQAAEGLRQRYAALARHGLVALPLAPGARFGKYRLLDELGRGGMGIVHLAEDIELHRRVALKLLSPALLGAGRAEVRFRREIAALAKIDHPGICTLLEAGEVHGQPFLAMRYVAGATLAACLEGARGSGARLPIDQIVRWVAEIAEAVGAAHAAGLVHRDLKPGNVMLGEDGRIVVLDFGLARDVTAEDASLTATHDLIGTAAYMAPEQVRGGEIGPWTDVHALGAILYEALTLSPAFPGAQRTEVLHRVVHDEPLHMRSMRPDASRELELVVATCLDKDSSRRYPHAAALAADLRRIQGRQPIAARPLPRWLRVWRWAQRNRIAAATIVSLCVLIALSSFFLLRIASSDRDSRAQRLVLASVGAERDAELSALFALAAWRLQPGVETLDFLRNKLFDVHELGIWRLPGASFQNLVVVDDQHLLTYGTEPWCALWRRDTAHPIARLEVQTAVNDVAIAPDGTIAIVSRGGRLRFFRSDGSRAAIADREFGQGRYVAWLDARHVVIGQFGRATVLDVHSGETRVLPLDEPLPGSSFDPTSSPVRCIVSADRSTLLLAGLGRVHVHDVQQGLPTRCHVLQGLPVDATFGAVAMSADGSRVVVAASSFQGNSTFAGTRSRFGGLWVRTDDDYEQGGEPLDPDSMALRACFSPDGSRFAIATDDGAVRVHDGADGELLKTSIVRDGAMIAGISWSADGRRLAATSIGRGTAVFDRDGQLLEELRCYGFFANTFTADGTLWTLELDTLQALRIGSPRRLLGHSAPLYCATPLSDGRIATCGKDNRTVVWRDGEQVGEFAFEGAETWTLHCAESPDGDLVTASLDYVVRRFTADGRVRAASIGPGAPQRVLPLPDGRTIVLTYSAPSVHVLGPDLEPIMSPIDAPGAWGGDLTPDGKWLIVAGSSTHELWLFDLENDTREPVHRLPVPTTWNLNAVAIADDGSFAVAGGGDGVLHRFDLGTGERTASWQAHDGPMLHADVSADGRIATSSNDRTAAVWSRGGELLARLAGHRAAVWTARFTLDGRNLVTASDDRTARIWPLDAKDVVAWARSCLHPERRRRELDAMRVIVGNLLDGR